MSLNVWTFIALVVALLPDSGMLPRQVNTDDDNAKMEPFPDSPGLQQQIHKSDVIVHAELLHNRSYKIGSQTMHQARFRVIKSLRTSPFFPLRTGDQFTVQFTVKPDIYGPHFMEEPERGEYIALLQLKNVKSQNKIVGQVLQFVIPEPFALYSPSPQIFQAIAESK